MAFFQSAPIRANPYRNQNLSRQRAPRNGPRRIDTLATELYAQQLKDCPTNPNGWVQCVEPGGRANLTVVCKRGVSDRVADGIVTTAYDTKYSPPAGTHSIAMNDFVPSSLDARSWVFPLAEGYTP